MRYTGADYYEKFLSHLYQNLLPRISYGNCVRLRRRRRRGRRRMKKSTRKQRRCNCHDLPLLNQIRMCIWVSHGTHMNESCHDLPLLNQIRMCIWVSHGTHEWVMSWLASFKPNQNVYMSESWHTYDSLILVASFEPNQNEGVGMQTSDEASS